jgi:hypothetical protein
MYEVSLVFSLVYFCQALQYNSLDGLLSVGTALVANEHKS